jgi:hypothetical protein
MPVLKLLLSAAAALVASQALAHKVSHAGVTIATDSRLAPAQTDSNPAALLQSIGGHAATSMASMPGSLPSTAPTKGTSNIVHINHRH